MKIALQAEVAHLLERCINYIRYGTLKSVFYLLKVMDRYSHAKNQLEHHGATWLHQFSVFGTGSSHAYCRFDKGSSQVWVANISFRGPGIPVQNLITPGGVGEAMFKLS